MFAVHCVQTTTKCYWVYKSHETTGKKPKHYIKQCKLLLAMPDCM